MRLQLDKAMNRSNAISNKYPVSRLPIETNWYAAGCRLPPIIQGKTLQLSNADSVLCARGRTLIATVVGVLMHSEIECRSSWRTLPAMIDLQPISTQDISSLRSLIAEQIDHSTEGQPSLCRYVRLSHITHS